MKYTQGENDSAPWVLNEAAAISPADPAAVVERIMNGLPVLEFDALRELLGLTVEDMARKIGISVATLSRRRQHREPLDPAHGDRIMRYARLYWLAVELHDGDSVTARAWLRRPAVGLKGRTPVDFAESETGAREVEYLIGRIEHGVYV
ncbi:MAG: antitoxin Xre-like helix-turn-helix domain-containing protein [Opitutaceae bacterium]|jgi:putative toxin-antitoxin system antitoxin component (TIGR02293 family)